MLELLLSFHSANLKKEKTNPETNSKKEIMGSKKSYFDKPIESKVKCRKYFSQIFRHKLKIFFKWEI